MNCASDDTIDFDISRCWESILNVKLIANDLIFTLGEVIVWSEF